jgi:hypothetical protein
MNKILLSVVCVLSFGWAEVDTNKVVPMAEALQISADTMNKSLPVMVDAELRHDKVEANKHTMILKFTLVNFTVEEMDGEKLKGLMEADIRQNVCTDAETQDMLKKGMKVTYDYTDKNKKHITQFKYDAKACGLESNMNKLKNILNLTKKN